MTSNATSHRAPSAASVGEAVAMLGHTLDSWLAGSAAA